MHHDQIITGVLDYYTLKYTCVAFVVFFSFRYYSVSIFCKVGAPGYVSSVVFGVVVNVATVCGVLTIDKVMYYFSKVCQGVHIV